MDGDIVYEIFENESDNKVIFEYYCLHENIEVYDSFGTKDCPVAVFFTGHGLYYPTNIKQFELEVLKNNKYEWKNISQNDKIAKRFSKFIFVRDVYKNWCINGIGQNVQTQDQLADKLKDIIKGQKCVTIGSSAGGYMAVLFGTLINAEAIYAFSPQISLYEYHKYHPIKYYENYVMDSNISKYMDLTERIRYYKGKIFYFFPYMCEEDYRQYLVAKNVQNINFFLMNQRKHGATIWGNSIIYVLTHPYEKLEMLSTQFSNMIIDPWIFSMKTVGLWKTMIFLIGKKVKSILT